MLVCDLVVLELTRLSPNEDRAREVAERMDAFDSVPMPGTLWTRARETQLLLAPEGGHRRVPPADLLLAAAAEATGVPLVHYDRDYDRIATVTDLKHKWMVADGSLA